jgi:hypothetical protein
MKLKKDEVLIDMIERFCKKHNLSGKIRKGIIKISIISYVEGSNDCFETFCKNDE